MDTKHKLTWVFIFPILVIVGGITVIASTLYSLYIGYKHHAWQEIIYVLASAWGLYIAYLFVGFNIINGWVEEEKQAAAGGAGSDHWRIQIDWNQGRYDPSEAYDILSRYMASEESFREALTENNLIYGDKATIQEIARRLKSAGLSVTLLPAPAGSSEADDNDE